MSSAPNSPGGVGGRKGDTGGQLLQELEALSQALYKAGGHTGQLPTNPPKDATGSNFLSRRETMPARHLSEYQASKPPPFGQTAPLSVSKRPSQRHSIAARPEVFGFEESEDNIRRGPFRHSISEDSDVNSFYEEEVDEPVLRPPRLIQPWHSQGFEKHMPEVTNFPAWLEDNINFSKKLEAPAEKKSIWNWKPFRTLAHIGQKRHDCLFTVHVHGIEGLPSAMNGLRLTVHWQHKDRSAQTMPSRVFQGSAEFEETLQLKCSVYGTKGAHHAVKYMPKAFTLSVIALDVDELTLGKHRLDPSRLLPETVDDEAPAVWRTSFKLAGKAKGGTLVVTFGYELERNKESKNSNSGSGRFGMAASPQMKTLRSFNAQPRSAHGTPRPRSVDTHLSPTMSEPGDYGDYGGIEHLNLDEVVPPQCNPYMIGAEIRPRNYNRVDLRPSAFAHGESKLRDFPQVDSVLAPPTPTQREQHFESAKESAMDISSANGYGSSDEEPEFDVVDQGVELDVLPTNLASLRSKGSVDFDELRRMEKLREFLPLKARGSDLPPRQVSLDTGYDELQTRQKTSQDSAYHEADVVREKFSQESAAHVSDLSRYSADHEQDLSDQCASNSTNLEQHSAEHQFFLDDQGHKIGAEGEERQDAPPELPLHEEQISDARCTGEEQDGNSELDLLVDHSYIQSPAFADSDTEDQETSWYQSKFEQRMEHADEEEEDASMLAEMARAYSYTGAEDSKPAIERSLLKTIELETASSFGRNAEYSMAGMSDLDEEVDLVAGEFLHMLEAGRDSVGVSSDSEPDSPRAKLLKQFEQEALLEGGFGLRLSVPEVPELNLDDLPEMHGNLHEEPLMDANGCSPGWQGEDVEDVELASIMEAAESELQKATQTMRSKTRAKMLEDAETEALMHEWGLNEKAFQSSPPKPAQGFMETYGITKTLEPPPLGQGLGPIVTVKDGGTLRSMSPGHFQGSSVTGKLLMQVSKPVVVPAEMGSSGLDILRRMASAGMEGMAIQALGAMKMDDITGKTVQQIASEGCGFLEGPSERNGNKMLSSNRAHADTRHRGGHQVADIITGTIANPALSSGSIRQTKVGDQSFDEYLSLEDLAPMAMQKIEALAMDGLRVQADMTDDSAPYNIHAIPLGDADSIFKKGSGVGMMEGVAALHLLDGRKYGADLSGEEDNLMSMSITLEEWMRLDAGICDEKQSKENTLAILSAHCASHKDLIVQGSKDDRERYRQNAKATSGRGGFMGNTLTIAMLVQLRDPLRNNEPVGLPMMALVQAERVIVPPKPRIPRHRISFKGNTEEVDPEEEDKAVPEVPDVPDVPQFKITAVHVAGLKASEESVKKKAWGSQKQQQSGSRWLLANGMGKGAKHPVLKSTPQPPIKTKVKPGESLWSISSRVHGTGSKWREVAALNPHIRNPDVIFANDTIRTR